MTFDGLKVSFRKHAESIGFELVGFDAMFNASLKELEGTFLSVNRWDGEISIGFHNPSVKDFTDAELRRDGFVLKNALLNFTFGGVLLFAAKQLAEHHQNDVTSSQCLDAMNRADNQTAICVSRYDSFVSRHAPLREETALHEWLAVVQGFKEQNATLKAIKKIEAFFRTIKAAEVRIEAVSDLYSAYSWAAFSIGYKDLIPLEEIYMALIDECETPEKLSAMIGFLPEDEGYEAELAVLQRKFHDCYWSWLDFQVDGASSSDNIREAISDVINAAGTLSIEESDLNLSDAETAASELEAKEQAEADADKEEWAMRRHNQIVESREIDDILGALVA